MNNFTFYGQIAENSGLRYTGDNQTPIATLKIALMNRFGSAETFEISAVAWGKVAESIATMPVGAVAHMVGQLNILQVQNDGGYKDAIASVKISEIVSKLGQTLVPFNQITLFGNVGQDVDARHFESGKQNAKFSLAVRRTKADTDWFNIETWGDTAKVCDQYLTKGSKVAVEGALKLETWTDKNTGNTRSKPVIAGDRITLGGKRGDDDNSGNNSGGGYDRQTSHYGNSTATREAVPLATRSAPAATKARSVVDEVDYEDIPF